MRPDVTPKRASDFYGGEGPFPHKQTNVFERDRSGDKPVLYDAKGNPLTWKRPRLGFAPPSERKP